jgi:hypothetical protein
LSAQEPTRPCLAGLRSRRCAAVHAPPVGLPRRCAQGPAAPAANAARSALPSARLHYRSASRDPQTDEPWQKARRHIAELLRRYAAKTNTAATLRKSSAMLRPQKSQSHLWPVVRRART